jgi:hypothetical protein
VRQENRAAVEVERLAVGISFVEGVVCGPTTGGQGTASLYRQRRVSLVMWRSRGNA